MTELYWLTRVGGINTACQIVFGLSIAVVASVLFAYGVTMGYSEDWDDITNKVKQHYKKVLLPLIISGLGLLFIPTQKEMYLIYGLGGTIDYIKSNDKAKQLPDKVIDAVDKYLENITKEEKK